MASRCTINGLATRNGMCLCSRLASCLLMRASRVKSATTSVWGAWTPRALSLRARPLWNNRRSHRSWIGARADWNVRRSRRRWVCSWHPMPAISVAPEWGPFERQLVPRNSNEWSEWTEPQRGVSRYSGRNRRGNWIQVWKRKRKIKEERKKARYQRLLLMIIGRNCLEIKSKLAENAKDKIYKIG